MPQSKSPFHDPNFININGKLHWGNVQSIRIVVKIVFFLVLIEEQKLTSASNFFYLYSRILLNLKKNVLVRNLSLCVVLQIRNLSLCVSVISSDYS